MTPSLAERLRSLRAARNLDKKDLVEALRVNPKTYTRWESGETEPSASAVVQLADYFAVENPKTPNIGVEIPRRTAIVTRVEAEQFQAEAQARLDEQKEAREVQTRGGRRFKEEGSQESQRLQALRELISRNVNDLDVIRQIATSGSEAEQVQAKAGLQRIDRHRQR
eukprot:Skav231417  [mRNA]  locus=scaffold7737:150:876:+ [translate_table: standard]